jgi:hypothetical protein
VLKGQNASRVVYCAVESGRKIIMMSNNGCKHERNVAELVDDHQSRIVMNEANT